MSLLSRFFGLAPRRVWGVPEEQVRIVFDNPTARGLLRSTRPYRSVDSIDEGGAVDSANTQASTLDSNAPGPNPHANQRPEARSNRDSDNFNLRASQDTGNSPGTPAPQIHQLTIRPAWGRDHVRIEKARWQDRDWLEPWEATIPPEANEKLPSLDEYLRQTDAEVEAGITLPMMIEVDGEVIGLVTAANTVRGALYSTTVGYWIISKYAGIGISSLAVASVIDVLILKLGIHRVEINIRPENQPSLGLARKLNLNEEGYRPRYMHIAGEWADHVAFAIDQESLPSSGLVNEIWGIPAREEFVRTGETE